MPRERIPSDVVTLGADDKKTRKMDAETFKALLNVDRQPAVTVPAPNVMKQLVEAEHAKEAPRKITTTAELMSQVDDAFADFGLDNELPAPEPVPVEAPLIDSKPVKRQAMIVADHRYDTRYAAAIAPITKPPPIKEAPVVSVAPSVVEPANRNMLVLVSVLAALIVVGIAIVLLR